jgi:hypothetical protein
MVAAYFDLISPLERIVSDNRCLYLVVRGQAASAFGTDSCRTQKSFMRIGKGLSSRLYALRRPKIFIYWTGAVFTLRFEHEAVVIDNIQCREIRDPMCGIWSARHSSAISSTISRHTAGAMVHTMDQIGSCLGLLV